MFHAEFSRRWTSAARSKVLLGELAEFVGHGLHEPERRPVFDGFPSEPVANLVDGAIGRVTRQPALGARLALLIVEPKRELELHVPARLKVRHRYGEERDRPLMAMV